jgi:TRAP-type mannitol/chloroaromatic compound transport system permease small subunit
MNFLRGLVRVIDTVNERIGRCTAWLALAMVLVQVVVVVMRYVFGLSVLTMQESIWYMHSIVFLVAAGYTLLHDGHVRVDVIYGGLGPRGKAWVDLFGVLFVLLPVCIMIWWVSWPYVAAAWRVREGSIEVSGIQGVYLLKTCILIFAGTLILQGISLAIKSALRIAARDEGSGDNGAEELHL